MKLKNFFLLVLSLLCLIALGFISDADYRDEIRDDQRWCERISSGVWRASLEEEISRCALIL
jgi:hypothetical protein